MSRWPKNFNTISYTSFFGHTHFIIIVTYVMDILANKLGTLIKSKIVLCWIRIYKYFRPRSAHVNSPVLLEYYFIDFEVPNTYVYLRLSYRLHMLVAKRKLIVSFLSKELNFSRIHDKTRIHHEKIELLDFMS